MKFQYRKNGNVNEIVYSILFDYYTTNGTLLCQNATIAFTQDALSNKGLPMAKRSTVKRAYRKMRTIINWHAIQDDLLRKQKERDIEFNRRVEELRIENETREDMVSKFFGIVVVIASLAIIGTILFSIFSYHV